MRMVAVRAAPAFDATVSNAPDGELLAVIHDGRLLTTQLQPEAASTVMLTVPPEVGAVVEGC